MADRMLELAEKLLPVVRELRGMTEDTVSAVGRAKALLDQSLESSPSRTERAWEQLREDLAQAGPSAAFQRLMLTTRSEFMRAADVAAELAGMERQARLLAVLADLESHLRSIVQDEQQTSQERTGIDPV